MLRRSHRQFLPVCRWIQIAIISSAVSWVERVVEGVEILIWFEYHREYSIESPFLRGFDFELKQNKKNTDPKMAGTVSADIPTSLASSAIFYSLFFPALILWFVYWKLSRRRLYKLAGELPGPEGYPIIGNALELVGTPHCKSTHFTSKWNLWTV